MIEKIAFSVPGTSGAPIEIPPVTGMPSGSGNLNIAIQWGLTVIFAAAAIVALFFIIWGGISWITSGGEKEKIEEARGKIVYAIIGLVIILASFFIVNTVGNLFGVDPLNSGNGIPECKGARPNCGALDSICNKNTGEWECTGGK